MSENSMDDVIDVYKKKINIAELDYCLSLTIEQRLIRLMNLTAQMEADGAVSPDNASYPA